MNRVTAMIENQRKAIKDRLAQGLITQEKVDSHCKTLDLSLEEYCNFQTHKSLASTDGTLTLEEAQTVYGYLGETLDHFNGQPVEVKAVLTKLYSELLQRALRHRGVKV
jgi:hypothetical protein